MGFQRYKKISGPREGSIKRGLERGKRLLHKTRKSGGETENVRKIYQTERESW